MSRRFFLTFISSTNCLYVEFFKSVLRLKAQQMPESVMAGLNNSEQFLLRPWQKDLECNNCHYFGRVDQFDDRRDFLLSSSNQGNIFGVICKACLTCQEQERSMWGLVGKEGKQGRAERQSKRNVPGYEDLSSPWNYHHPLGCL